MIHIQNMAFVRGSDYSWFDPVTPNLLYKGGRTMAESVYKIVELVGASDSSWEEAAHNAVETAGRSLKDLRIAEVTKFDMTIENGKVTSYRTRINLSFKYRKED